jgi:hypothetical protein
MPVFDKDWNLSNPPPEGHKDVAMWAYQLWYDSQREKERLGLGDRWFESHRLYRGDHWNRNRSFNRDDKHKVTVNLIFANTNRTVANLTSRDPIAELHSADGIEDDADKQFSQKIKNWWSETEQSEVLAKSALQMETYGTTIEKYVPNLAKNTLDVHIVDNFNWFPAPGYYDDIQDMPYMCFASPLPVHYTESKFGVEGVESDDVYNLLGQDREDNVPIPSGSRYGVINAGGMWVGTQGPSRQDRNTRTARALVIEVWVRDPSIKKVSADAGGEAEPLKYPGGIRKITITNRGNLLLDDSANPNVNPAIPSGQAMKSYGWSNYPCAIARSYEDSISVWGFSASEQVGDLNLKIDEILSRIKAYIDLVCMPALIIPQDCGIIPRGPGSEVKITNKAGLILQPSNKAVAAGIRYLVTPNLPSDFFQILDKYLQFFDRIHAIQDVDRGEKPANIQAAAAIMTLQERNAVLMRHKVRSTDYLVRERGRWAISFYQNFHYIPETITVNDAPQKFRGTDFAGRQFNYVVESGSTVAKTNLQQQQDLKELFQMGAVDTQALLEGMNIKDWKAILDRMSGDKLQMALQVLTDLGIPSDVLQQIQQMAAQTVQTAKTNPQAAQAQGDGKKRVMASPEQMQGIQSSNKYKADLPAGMSGGSNPGTPVDGGLMK